MKIWIFTDCHIGRLPTSDFQNAINDIKNVAYPDLVLALGDLVNDSLESQFDTYLSIKNGSGLADRWFELLGNHDISYGTITQRGACDKLGIEPCYEVIVGNLVFLMVSDIGTPDGSQYNQVCGDVTDEQWNWIQQKLAYWNKLPVNLFLCTHQPPYNSTYSSTESCMYQINRDWASLLDRYKVDVWLHGHVHSSSVYSPWQTTWHNCKVISCNSLANWCIFGANPIDSKVMYINEGEKEALFKYRNHETQSWNSTYDVTIPLRYAFDPNWTPEEVPQIPQLPEMITEMIGGTLAIIILAEFLRKLHRDRRRKS